MTIPNNNHKWHRIVVAAQTLLILIVLLVNSVHGNGPTDEKPQKKIILKDALQQYYHKHQDEKFAQIRERLGTASHSQLSNKPIVNAKMVGHLVAKTVYGLTSKEEYVAKLLPGDQYFLPNDIRGVVQRSAETKQLHSNNQAINALLEYVQKRLEMDGGHLSKETHVELSKLVMPTHGCSFSLKMDRLTRNKAFLWDQAVSIPQNEIDKFLEKKNPETNDEEDRDVQLGTAISQKDIDDFMAKYGMQKEVPKKKGKKKSSEKKAEGEEEEEDDDENFGQITTYALLEAIQKGSRAFGDEALLTWKNLPELDEYKIDKPGFFRRVFAIIVNAFSDLIKNVVQKFVKPKEKQQNPRVQEEKKKNGFENFAETVGSWFKAKKVVVNEQVQEVLDEIEQGKKAAMAEAKKSLAGMQAAKFFSNAQEMHEKIANSEQKPFEFLQSVRYDMESVPAAVKGAAQPAEHANATGCGKLKEIVQLVIYPEHRSNSKEEGSEIQNRVENAAASKIHSELRGRLGANQLLSIMNAKRMSTGLILGLVMSFGMTGGIAIVIDVVLYGALIAMTLTSAGAWGPLTIPLMFLIPSLSPLVAETADSFIVKRMLGLLRGKPFWPQSGKELWSNLKEAFVAGGIASLGSMPYNALTAFASGWAYLPLKALANFLGTSTSAAMVPIEINKMGGYTSASVVMKMEEGFLRKPNPIEIANHLRGKKGMSTDMTALNINKVGMEKAMRDYIMLKTDRVMRVAQASAMAINSMGTGAILSFFCGFLMFAIPNELGWLPHKVMEISSTLFNSPTEALTMNAQTIAANQVGSRWPKLTSTDAQKNEAMMQLIFEKAILQLESATNKEKTVPITYGEVHSVYRPMLIVSAPLGEWVQNTMNKAFHLLHFTDNMKDQVTASGLVDEASENVIENWRKGIVYVVQRPQIATLAQSPHDLKLISWLKLHNIPHQVYSHPLFLCAQFTEQLPLVELDGETIVGSTDSIIEKLSGMLGIVSADLELSEAELKQRESVRKLIDGTMQKILLYDRSLSVEHVAKDANIQKLLMPVLLENARADIHTATGIKQVELTEQFWQEYTQTGTVKQGNEKWNGGNMNILAPEQAKYRDYVSHELAQQIAADHWGKRKQWHREMLQGAQALMKFQLMIHKLDVGNEKSPKTFAEVSNDFKNHEPVVDALKKVAEQLAAQLENSKKNPGQKGFYLFGTEPTPADASLYALLVQFMATEQLNVAGIKNYFAHIKGQHSHVFNQFVAQFQAHGQQVSTHQAVGDKYNGPYGLAPEHDELELSEHEADFDEQGKLDVALLDTKHQSSVARRQVEKAKQLNELLFKELPSLLKANAKTHLVEVGDDVRVDFAYPALKHILLGIADIVNAKDANELNLRAIHRGANKQLREAYSELYKYVHHDKKAHAGLPIAHAMVEHVADYLCHEECAKHHAGGKASAKMQINEELKKYVHNVVYNQMASYNELVAQIKMKALGHRMYNLNKTSHEKVGKWLKQQAEGAQPPSLGERAKDWLLQRLMDLLKFKKTDAMEQVQEALKAANQQGSMTPEL